MTLPAVLAGPGPHAGAALWPASAGPIERTHMAVEADRVVPADLIRDVWDPDRCPSELLPWLAHALSVDLWFDDWDDLTKRRVIASEIERARLKGTLAGYRAYLALAGVEVISVTRPPHRCVASPGLTAEERRRWAAGLDQLRVHVDRTRRPAHRQEPIGHRAVAGDCVALPMDPRRMERRAEIVSGGVTTPVRWGLVPGEVAPGLGVPVERIVVSGRGDPRRASATGRCLSGGCVPVVARVGRVFTLGVDRRGDAASAMLAGGVDGLAVVTTRPERIGEVGTRDPRIAVVGAAVAMVAAPRTLSIFDRWYLAPTSASPAPPAHPGTVVGLSRVSFPAHTLEFRLSRPTRGSARRAVVGGPVGSVPPLASDPWGRIGAALDAGRAERDGLRFVTHLYRPRRLSDGLSLTGGGTRLGSLVSEVSR